MRETGQNQAARLSAPRQACLLAADDTYISASHDYLSAYSPPTTPRASATTLCLSNGGQDRGDEPNQRKLGLQDGGGWVHLDWAAHVAGGFWQ